MKVSDRAIAMFGAWLPARQAISIAIPRTRRLTLVPVESENRAMNKSAGAGHDIASTVMAAMIPAELATSTSIRPNANRDDAMSCPGWKCGTLLAVSHLSVTSSVAYLMVHTRGSRSMPATMTCDDD